MHSAVETSPSAAFQPQKGLLDIQGLVLMLRRQLRCIVLWTLAAALALSLAFFLYPFAFSATALILLDPRPQRISPSPEILPGLGSDSAALESQVQYMQSAEFLGEVIDKLDLQSDPAFLKGVRGSPSWPGWRDALVQRFRQNMTVARKGLTYVVEVSYRDKRPVRAAAFANAIAKTYVEQQVADRVGVAAETSRWLKDHLRELREKAMGSDKAVADFRARHNIVEAGAGNTLRERQITDLTQQLALAQAAAADAEARSRQLSSADAASVTRNGDDFQSQVLTNLRSQYAALSRQHTEIATVYGVRHPSYIAARLQIENLRVQINAEIARLRVKVHSDFAAAREKAALLEKQLAGLQKNATLTDQAAVELRELEREASADRTLYEQYLNRQKEAEGQTGVNRTEVRVVSEALPPARSTRPKLPIGLAAIGVLSLACGLGAALLREARETGFQNAAQIEQRLGIGTVGVLPVLEADPAAFQKALRLMLPVVRMARTMLVTSAFPGEGKSLLARHIAAALAGQGREVLLVEADFKGPVEEAPSGLRELILGDRTPWTVIGTDVETGVHRLFLGAVEDWEDYHKLMLHPELAPLLQRFKERFGAVIIDGPPALTVVSETALVEQVDLTIMPVLWRKTPQAAVEHAMEALARGGEIDVYPVLNKVDLRAYPLYDRVCA